MSKTLAGVARKYNAQKYEIKILEAELKQLKEDARKEEISLSETLSDSGLESIKVDGSTFFQRIDNYASVDSANSEAAFEFIREAGYEDIIKMTINARSLTSALKDIEEQTGKTPSEGDGINVRTVNRVGIRR
jgi:hypothetical protein